jgi:hypothetical protein
MVPVLAPNIQMASVLMVDTVRTGTYEMNGYLLNRTLMGH